jgi:hypothetical protein
MYVTFIREGKTYRVDVDTELVEEFVDNKWERVVGGRVVRTARMEINEWVKLTTRGKQ